MTYAKFFFFKCLSVLEYNLIFSIIPLFSHAESKLHADQRGLSSPHKNSIIGTIIYTSEKTEIYAVSSSLKSPYIVMALTENNSFSNWKKLSYLHHSLLSAMLNFKLSILIPACSIFSVKAFSRGG